MKARIKKLLAFALCLATLAGLTPALRTQAEAAALVDINDSSVFLKQTANACTFYSVLMMFRRGALLNGNPNWDSFTADNYRSAWWIDGIGIWNSLSGEGMRAEKVTLDGTADPAGRKQMFIELLEAHPEGLTIWLARGSWHAVLLTDYDCAADTFYCADPSPSVPLGRVPLVQSILAWPEYSGRSGSSQEDILACVSAYWYIKEGVTLPERHQVQRSAQDLIVDGVRRDVEKYNIDGSNYFMLRDLAYLLDGTGSRFSVGWDGATGTVTVTSGEGYEPNGSEMVVGTDKSADAAVSAQTIVINGAVRGDLSVFNIGGHNFFKLRELGEALGFDVDYDAAADTVIVRSR